MKTTTSGYPTVLSEWETLDRLLQGQSIARYGDGELKLCLGRSAKAQSANPEIQKRLLEILKSDSDCLVGIPNIADTRQMAERKREFWKQYQGRQYTQLYRSGKVYASAFITRPDSAPSIAKAEYFEQVQKLWAGRDVILINGTNKAFDKDPDFLRGCRFTRWTYPNNDAWDVYPELVSRCLKESKEKLFIASLGPTATVLAYDLAENGYQALDLGHMAMFYRNLECKA